MVSRTTWAIIVTALASGFVNYAVGLHQGEIDGVKLAHDEQNVRVTENEHEMQRIGVCQFAKVMAENSFCKAERDHDQGAR